MAKHCLTDAELTDVRQALHDTGAMKECVQCGGKRYMLGCIVWLDNSSPQLIRGTFPCVLVSCRNCGFVTLHLLSELRHALSLTLTQPGLPTS